MAREQAAHLRIVDTETGALSELDECPNCRELDRELRRQRTIIANLRRDKAQEARDHQLWGLAVALFWEWKIVTGHMRSKWSVDRFWTCHPNLSDDGFELCRFAVWGLAANAFEKAVTSTYTKRYDEFWRVFGTKDRPVRDTFEENVNAGRAIFGIDLPQEPVRDVA